MLIKKKLLDYGLRFSLSIVSILFLVYSLFINFDNISLGIFNSSSFIFLFVSFSLTVVSIFVNALAWKLLVEWFGYENSKINMIILFVKTNIYKYTPGGIWHFVSRINAMRGSNSVSSILLPVFLEPFLMLIAALVWLPLGDWNLLIKILSISSLLIFNSRFILLILKPLEKLIYSKIQKWDSSKIKIKPNLYLKLEIDGYPFKSFFTEMAFVFIRFIGFWLCINAFSINQNIAFFQWLSVYSLAWIIGLIVPAAPGGLGVFESSILLLIGEITWEANLLTALVCYRFISIVSDLVSYSLVFSRRIKLKI